MTLLIGAVAFLSRTFSDDELRTGRDAHFLAVGVVAVAGNNAGDVRAVAEVVVLLRLCS